MAEKIYIKFFFNFEGIKKDYMYSVHDMHKEFESGITSYFFKTEDGITTVVRAKGGDSDKHFEIIRES